ncbi:MAG: phosphoribosyltransferase [Veillonella sp.]|jgi:hypothetical protein|nr:phosphoribosyltransferase [Veillonella sp.]
MERFTLRKNDYLSRHTLGYFHQLYLGYQKPGNPDFLNTLKNMLNRYSNYQIEAARQEVYDRVRKDLPAIIAERELDEVVVVVVPRSKVFKNPSQLGFRLTIQDCVRVLRNNGYPNIIDGTECIKRHTDTKTTHLHKFLAGFYNTGHAPYVGITKATCHIDADKVRGKTIILVDDIYTKTVNVDEDCIEALYKAGAERVILYVIGYTQHNN